MLKESSKILKPRKERKEIKIDIGLKRKKKEELSKSEVKISSQVENKEGHPNISMRNKP